MAGIDGLFDRCSFAEAKSFDEPEPREEPRQRPAMLFKKQRMGKEVRRKSKRKGPRGLAL